MINALFLHPAGYQNNRNGLCAKCKSNFHTLQSKMKLFSKNRTADKNKQKHKNSLGILHLLQCYQTVIPGNCSKDKKQNRHNIGKWNGYGNQMENMFKQPQSKTVNPIPGI